MKAHRITGILFALTTAALGQGVNQARETPCNDEIVKANFELNARKRVFGELKDQTGAVFQNSKVSLRKQGRSGGFTEYRTVETDKEGRFDLKSVDGGRYRFLPAPNRGFRQPNAVECGDSVECEIKLTLQVSPTDQEFGACPVQ